MKTEAPVSLRIMEALSQERGDRLGFRTVRRGEAIISDPGETRENVLYLAKNLKIAYGPTIFIEEAGKPATTEGSKRLQELHASAERTAQCILNGA